MHKFRVLLELEKGNINEAQASELLKCTPRTVKHLMTLWRGKLKHIVPLIDKLLEPVNTKSDQAALKEALITQMQISLRQVNRLLKSSEIVLPLPLKSLNRVKMHENARNRIDTRKKYALDVIAGLADAQYAAEMAETTKRHVYRTMSLFLEPRGYTNRDLRRMSNTARRMLANEIESDWKKGNV